MQTRASSRTQFTGCLEYSRTLQQISLAFFVFILPLENLNKGDIDVEYAQNIEECAILSGIR